jgi:uncharacterized membrane protein YdjX (TVP38/TMEM64 family)
MEKTTRTALKIAIAAILIAVIVLLEIRFHLSSRIRPEVLINVMKRLDAWAPLVYMALMALAIIISPIPSVPLDIAAGIVFGPLLGTIYSVIGATIGAVVSFLLARILGRELIEGFLRGHINFCTDCSDKILAKIVFLSRLIPVISFDIISYGAGLTKMSLKAFTIATILGMIPLTFLYTAYGSILTINAWIGIVVGVIFIILFLAAPPIIEKYDLFSPKKPDDGKSHECSSG